MTTDFVFYVFCFLFLQQRSYVDSAMHGILEQLLSLDMHFCVAGRKQQNRFSCVKMTTSLCPSCRVHSNGRQSLLRLILVALVKTGSLKCEHHIWYGD